MPSAPRLLIVGLDCAEPSLVFERWHADLPHLARLMRRGSYGRLESCIPAITVPAWSCMFSGRDPGELGIYGFRNRADRSYQSMVIADSHMVRAPRLWELLGQAGWRVAVIGVPGTYPPQPVNGVLVSDCLAPHTGVEYTYPPSLAAQISDWLGEYMLDVPNFRSDDKARILRDIYTMCDQRFTLARQIWDHEQPDLLMLVEMGVDRIHHALWKQMDPQHPLYAPNAPLADAIHAYYCHVDRRIGELLTICDEQTLVLVVSDHGAQPLQGGIALNEWLLAMGYLVLHQAPPSNDGRGQPLQADMVDWSRSRAWGAGGYYGRVFLNVQGREPNGVIPLAHYEQERRTLAAHLQALPGPDGQPLGTRVFFPQQIYRRVRGIAPDLLVYFGDLAWRAVGTVGTGTLYTRENDTGPDDANHAQYGLFIWYDPQQPGNGQYLTGMHLYDILPTLLRRSGLPIPTDMRGKVWPW